MNRKSIVLQSLALAGCLLLARGASASPLTAYGVDSSLGGAMEFTSTDVDYMGNQFTLTAKDNGPDPYQNVGLALEFFYPTTTDNVGDNDNNDAALGLATGPGFTYVSPGTWNAGGTQQLSITGVEMPYTSTLQLLDPSQIIVPPSNTQAGDPGPTYSASIAEADSIPLIELGDFSPGDTKTFTVGFNETGGSFEFLSDSYFVAVPEPSSLLLGLLGMASVLAFCGRRSQTN